MAALGILNLILPIPELLPHIRADLQLFGVPLGGPKARTGVSLNLCRTKEAKECENESHTFVLQATILVGRGYLFHLIPTMSGPWNSCPIPDASPNNPLSKGLEGSPGKGPALGLSGRGDPLSPAAWA
ncbi:hypothetical protein N7449_005590 [Penicillium cf. viridicatum]|uniref:Uncharacterized protein n=1 Tax=Penicillium cf. viridicatum TaxID=2972119 RepID=A0A9W9SZD9_9EURO|nr:hypothetical protein N7449_005590 [Penicillium cf. viridicatum]